MSQQRSYTPQVIVKKVHRQGKDYIGLYFKYHRDTIEAIKSLDNRIYVPEEKCWCIPNTRSAFKAFKALRLPFMIDQDSRNMTNSGSTGHSRPKGVTAGIDSPIDCRNSALLSQADKKAADIRKEGKSSVQIRWHRNHFYVELSYNRSAIDFIKSLQGAWWNKKARIWVIGSSMDNLRKLQQYFSCWSFGDYNRLSDLINSEKDPPVVEIYRMPECPKKIAVKVRGFRVDYSCIKGLPNRVWDRQYKRWIIPFDKVLIQRMIKYYDKKGVKIINRLPERVTKYECEGRSLADRQTYLLSKIPATCRSILKEYTDVMIGQRYSWNSIRTYAGEFLKFVTYLGVGNLKDCNAEQVTSYLNTIAGTKASDSLLNTATSAIKFYFEKVAFRLSFEIEKIKRPRKSRHLPTILSIGEVNRMFETVTNLKHICILYTIYSSGLRLNELLSLRVDDVHWERSQLFVRKSKNKKDRMVMLSHSLKEVITKYADEYKPCHWLFEGQDRKSRYSAKSVQQIVKRAAQKAGISRRVTPHTLRHCFATHLLDRGTDVRYIQELLGHKDIKTTLVYTHVTTRRVTSIESPLDSMLKQTKKRNSDNET